MTLTTPGKRSWISIWFFLSSLVVFWDLSYCFLRPRSMPGGDLHWLFKPYSIYMKVDYIYGLPSFQRGDGFTNAQAFLNLIENLLNFLYLYKTHLAPSPVAPLIGLVSATMTVSKTTLYFAQEYFCNFCAVGHNTLVDLIFLYIIPDGLWIVVPSFVIYALWHDVAGPLYAVKKGSKHDGKVKAH